MFNRGFRAAPMIFNLFKKDGTMKTDIVEKEKQKLANLWKKAVELFGGGNSFLSEVLAKHTGKNDSGIRAYFTRQTFAEATSRALYTEALEYLIKTYNTPKKVERLKNEMKQKVLGSWQKLSFYSRRNGVTTDVLQRDFFLAMKKNDHTYFKYIDGVPYVRADYVCDENNAELINSNDNDQITEIMQEYQKALLLFGKKPMLLAREAEKISDVSASTFYNYFRFCGKERKTATQIIKRHKYSSILKRIMAKHAK